MMSEYIVVSMTVLPLLTGVIVWFIKDRQAQQLKQSLASEQHEREADRRVYEEKITALEATIANEKKLTEERIKGLQMAEAAMSEHFKALSGDVLRHSSEEFRKQAAASFKQQQDHVGQSVSSLIKPITEALQKAGEQIRSIEKSRHESFGSLTEQIRYIQESNQQLQLETRNLVTALRRPEIRGQWGEMTLKRVAELAGMMEHCDFVEQEQIVEGGKSLRPDMIVRMPDNRELIVDAKTPLDAYLSAIETGDDKQRKQFLAQHAHNISQRIKELASKAYWEQFKHSPDYVVLFIPGEQFLTAALEQDGKLLEDALKNRVVLATPTTIIALLRAVAFGWRQTAVTENAEKIQELGQDLHKRIITFVEHLTKIGKGLSTSVESYNKAIGSLERQVLPGARRFEEMGIQSKKILGQPRALEETPRSTRHLPGNDDAI